ncbi:putative ABC transporter ATP-binding protein YheS [Pseudovibrio axinellae]|uniref:Putative ABC transporter ATP-binding protein YheS n=1 Tax=Pseudovibrio axinellae TaxID=989403 RepID=A0A165T3R2_9HYPH|nr:ABC-F family ATP-binding cassette domain-containing protein [Pseudovibrio axinellae]KZL05385.1 putative ABC transporter ATP-binding protein YheS [Pseudovibrio axinellae]SER37422.1 ATPase components of ABC transporters with duplicated ATPase domains [Pseudovibrio axinellae]
MPLSISINNLSWSLPDGTPLFSDLNLQFPLARTGLIGRNGTGKTTLLNLISGALSPVSGSVVVHGSIGLLKQQVQNTGQETVADLFGITDALRILKNAENGTASVDELSRADWMLESKVETALAHMGLEFDMLHPLSALSGGQVTRCRLAALQFHDADFLLLDEPTNNLDADGRIALSSFLARWNKGAIVVSHDRRLLEQVDNIVELTTLGASAFGGNYSFYKAQKALELSAAKQKLADCEKQISDLNQKIQGVAERKARKDSTGQHSRAKRDQPKVLLNARRNKAENTLGQNTNLATKLREDAQKKANEARLSIEVLEPLTMSIASSGIALGQTVLCAENLCCGYSEAEPQIVSLSLVMIGPERRAISGPNGSGKTTLLNTLTGQLPPLSGRCNLHPTARILDQQVSLLDVDLSILENFRRLNPELEENACRAVLARFMYRGDASTKLVKTLSGGMLLRAGLACVLGAAQPPKLLILDEPTNHLDIEATKAIETGLNAYDGALLVVSHDAEFLQNIGITRETNLSDLATLPQTLKQL